jgi:hypothetical protein
MVVAPTVIAEGARAGEVFAASTLLLPAERLDSKVSQCVCFYSLMTYQPR